MRTATSIRVADQSFSIINDRLLTGRNRHSGKRWWRWREDSAYIFSTKQRYKDGRPRPILYRADNMHGITNAFYERAMFANRIADLGEQATELFNDFVETRLGHENILLPAADIINYGYTNGYRLGTLMFPMLEHLKTIDIVGRTGVLSSALAQSNLIDYTQTLFGPKYYRKDLVKALGQSPLDLHPQAYAARGIVPTDWIIEGLKRQSAVNEYNRVVNPNIHFLDEEECRSFRFILKNVPLSTRKKVVLGDAVPYDLKLGDIVRMMLTDGDVITDIPKVDSLRELHDALINEYQRRNPPAPFPRFTAESITVTLTDTGPEEIPLNTQTEQILAVPTPGFRVIRAETRGMLSNWSQEMHNCIYSYFWDAQSENKSYLAVYKDDTMIANVEVKGRRIMQFLGKRNRPFSGEERTEIQPILDAWTQAGVVSDDFTQALGLDERKTVYAYV